MKKRTRTKNRILIYSIGILAVIAYTLLMDNTSFTDKKTSVELCSILPKPNSAEMDEGLIILGVNSIIYYNNPELEPAARNIARDIYRLTGTLVPVSSKKDKYADIQLLLTEQLDRDEYQLNIRETIKVKAGGVQGAQLGCVSLAQLCISHLGKVAFPKATITDKPESEYRGLLLDLARQWHSIMDVKQVVEVCRWYKTNYLQLHLTDDQSFTFPSRAFPDLPTKGRSYTMEELRGLVKFANQKGVTLIPELEVPGHSKLMRKVEPFGLEGIHVINMLDEKVYEALDLLIGEMCDVFESSPYFHIGADECWMEGVGETQPEKEFMALNNLEDHHDIYNYFIVRMNEIVKKHGKKTLVWEGFKGQGSKNVSIPHDITVFAWESLYQRPDSLLKNGYTMINASWQPLYIVPHRSWEPEYIFNWNIYRFENWLDRAPSFNPIQLDSTSQIIGAQMCAWENKPQYGLPAVMYRLPAMSDRCWIPTIAAGNFNYFDYRHKIQDTKLRKVLYPFDVKIEGLSFPGYIGEDQKKPYLFADAVWINIKSHRDDITIRYTTDGRQPGPRDQAFTRELKISDNASLKIQAFNEKGQLVGYPEWYPLEKNE